MRKLLLLLLLILIGCSQEPYVYYHTNGDREEGTYKNGIPEGPYVYYFNSGESNPLPNVSAIIANLFRGFICPFIKK